LQYIKRQCIYSLVELILLGFNTVVVSVMSSCGAAWGLERCDSQPDMHEASAAASTLHRIKSVNIDHSSTTQQKATTIRPKLAHSWAIIIATTKQ
jgi:hypothetical protein